jgi:hypothetical protein
MLHVHLQTSSSSHGHPCSTLAQHMHARGMKAAGRPRYLRLTPSLSCRPVRCSCRSCMEALDSPAGHVSCAWTNRAAFPRYPYQRLPLGNDVDPGSSWNACVQAKFLRPDEAMVERLASVLAEKKIGIVAHFYMDPEVQVCNPIEMGTRGCVSFL